MEGQLLTSVVVVGLCHGMSKGPAHHIRERLQDNRKHFDNVASFKERPRSLFEAKPSALINTQVAVSEVLESETYTFCSRQNIHVFVHAQPINKSSQHVRVLSVSPD